MTIRFGDVVTVAGGAYSGKLRPVLVFQNPSLRTGDSVIVIPFTTVRNPSIEARIQVAPTAANGLGRDCFLEVDKLSAIRADWIGARVGCLDQETLNAAIRLSRELLSPGE